MNFLQWADSDTVILGNTNPKVFSISDPGTLLSTLSGIGGIVFPARTETMEFAYVLNSSRYLHKVTPQPHPQPATIYWP